MLNTVCTVFSVFFIRLCSTPGQTPCLLLCVFTCTEPNSVHGKNQGSHGDLYSLFGGGGLANNLLSLSFCISEKVVFRKREG